MKRAATGARCMSDAFDMVNPDAGEVGGAAAACTLDDDGSSVAQEALQVLSNAEASPVAAARIIASDAKNPPPEVRHGAVARAQKLSKIITVAGPTDVCGLLYPSAAQGSTWYGAVVQRVRDVFQATDAIPPPDLEANLRGTAVHVEHARRFLTAVGLIDWYSSSCESLPELYNRNRSAFPVDYRSLRVHDDTSTTLLALDAFRRSGYIVDADRSVQFPRGTLRSSRMDDCKRRVLLMSGIACCAEAGAQIYEATDDEVAAFQRVVRTYNENAAKFQVSPVSIQTDLYTTYGEPKTLEQLIVDADGTRCAEGTCQCPGWQFPAATTAGAAAAAGLSTGFLFTGDVAVAACGMVAGAASGTLWSMFATQQRCTTCGGGRQVPCVPAVQPPPTYPVRISAQRLTDMFTGVQQTTQQIEARLDSVLQYGFAGLDLHIDYVLATNDFVAALCTLTDRLANADFVDDVSRLRASALHTVDGDGVLDLYHDVEWNYFRARHTGQQLLLAETWGATRALQATPTVQALRAVVQGMYAKVRSSLSTMWQVVTSWAKLTSVIAATGSLIYGVATGALQSYAQWLTPQGLAQAAGHATSQGVMALAFLAASKEFVTDVWRQLTRDNIAKFLRYGAGIDSIAAPTQQIVPLEHLKNIVAPLADSPLNNTVHTMVATYETTSAQPDLNNLLVLVDDILLKMPARMPEKIVAVKTDLQQLRAVIRKALSDTTEQTALANAFSTWLAETCANAKTVANIASIVTLALLAGLAIDWGFVYQVGTSSSSAPVTAERLERLGRPLGLPRQLSGRGYRYSTQQRRMVRDANDDNGALRPPPPPIRRQ